MSAYSVLSLLSVAALQSVLSAVSIGSILCLASSYSILSIASHASVLSVASTQSILSVGSRGCSMKMWTDCYNPHTACLNDGYADFTLHIDATTWDHMAACSHAEYVSSNRPDRCDYQPATCGFEGVAMPCQVRRKGMASWRDLHQKPSFKVKMDRAVQWEDATCQYCPPGESRNVWYTKKVTLNNQVQHTGEIDAYRTFREHGIAPLARSTHVALYRGDELQSTQSYAMVETVNDKAFMAKHFGEDYALYEVEYNRIEPKRAAGAVELDASPAYAAYILNQLPFAAMNSDNVLHYFASERVTVHWDGACYKEWKNNYFIAYNGEQYFFIPHGVDQTFQCEQWHALTSMAPMCAPMKDCFSNATCVAAFEVAESSVMDDSKLVCC